jgi:hypothetical protein
MKVLVSFLFSFIPKELNSLLLLAFLFKSPYNGIIIIQINKLKENNTDLVLIWNPSSWKRIHDINGRQLLHLNKKKNKLFSFIKKMVDITNRVEVKTVYIVRCVCIFRFCTEF